MACLANGRSVVEFVAIDADAHGGHAGDLRHRGHLRDLAVARFALDASGDVLAVRPVHPGSDCVDAHPRDGLARFCEGGELLDRWLFRRHRIVTRHTRARRRERHQVARLRVRVAHAAFEANRQMHLVAVGYWLRRRRVLGDVRGHFSLRVRCPRQLLCLCKDCREQQSRNERGCSKPGNLENPITSHKHPLNF